MQRQPSLQLARGKYGESPAGIHSTYKVTSAIQVKQLPQTDLQLHKYGDMKKPPAKLLALLSDSSFCLWYWFQPTKELKIVGIVGLWLERRV